MRWWLQTDTKLFSVDNAVAKGLDYSALPPDVWMVHWTDGRGEIEHQAADGSNLNGLRETFIDVIPYCSYFQQFMRMLPGLTLPQAQKVQKELVVEVFDSKRQAPFHYPVAAGDYWWDATDETLTSSTAAGLQTATATLNALIDKVNELVSAINANVVAGVNARVVAPGNSVIVQANSAYAVIVNGTNTSLAGIVSGINGILSSLAAEINGDFAGIASEIGSNIVGTGNSTIAHINNTMLGVAIGPGDPTNTINNKLRDYNPGGAERVIPGLTADIAHNGFSFYGVSTYSVSTYSITGIPGITGTTSITAAFTDLNPIPWTSIGHVPVAIAEWIPIGATAPVPVTPDEQAAILSGIAARANDLNVKKNAKIAAITALTDIDDVIDYDVTVGW